MSLAHCTLAKECAFCVVAHALSTEKQEVMGLLFGRWDGSQAFIEEAHPLARTDRRADRVEVKPEQLAKAASIAESRGLRIVGWYHSHPHITALPSHVDVRTQRAYQVLDDRFVGIIAACFPGVDGAAAARGAPAVTLAAFQARSTSEPGAFAAPLALPASPPPAYATVDATSVPVSTEAHAGRDVPLSIASAETPGALAAALRGLAALQDALLAEEVAARRAAAPGDEGAGAFCDAVFRKAATLLRADALHPLIHVAGAWRGHEQRRRDAALAERDRLLAETSASA